MKTIKSNRFFKVDNGFQTPEYDEARLEALHESKSSGGREVKVVEYIDGKPSGWTSTERVWK